MLDLTDMNECLQALKTTKVVFSLQCKYIVDRGQEYKSQTVAFTETESYCKNIRMPSRRKTKYSKRLEELCLVLLTFYGKADGKRMLFQNIWLPFHLHLCVSGKSIKRFTICCLFENSYLPVAI